MAARGTAIAALAVITALGWGSAALAQESGGVPGDLPPAPVVPGPDVPVTEPQVTAGEQGQQLLLVLNQNELFENSAWGRAAIRATEEAAVALAAENRTIEASLEEEERALTVKRSTMSAAEFAPLAEAFDLRVEDIRKEQDAKSRAFSRRLDEDRAVFIEQAGPVLVQILDEYGAVAIVAKDTLILSRASADVTQRAIELVDQRLPAPVSDAGPQEGEAATGEVPAGEVPAGEGTAPDGAP